jgi:hypothetical protein
MAKHWLVTWTTYAAWLPGDPRGFRTWRAREYVPPPERYVVSAETTYQSPMYQRRHETAQSAAGSPIQLTPDQRQTVLTATVHELAQTPLEPTILSVEAAHIHLLAEFGEAVIRRMVGRLKSAATRALKEHGSEPTKRFWAKGCHMRSFSAEPSIRRAFEYVQRHRDQGAAIHTWRTP